MTSLSNNYASSPNNNSTGSNTVNITSTYPQHDYYLCVNPAGGLPAGTYHIEQLAQDPSNPLANIEWALDVNTSNYYVRRLISFNPNVWSAWSQVNGGIGAGVVSFNGRVGVVVGVTGDYTASQITNVPFGNVPAADTDVQSAIDYLQIYAPPPSAYATVTAPTVINNGVGWVNLPTTLQVAMSRSGAPGGSWAAPADGIQDIQNVNPMAATVMEVSAVVSTVLGIPAGPGQLGIRILRNGVIIIAQNLNENDQTGLSQTFSVSGLIRAVTGDIYTLQVINNTAGPFTIANGQLDLIQLGPTP